MNQEIQGVSVVVPVYNSQATLVALVQRLEPVLRAIGDFEIILVNDGSSDQSWSVIQKLATQFRFVTGINLMRNYGQHNALMCGIRAAKYAITCTLDDDLQNPPEEIPKLLAALGDSFDVVYGAPQKERHGLWRDLVSQITKLALQHAMGAATARNISAFRVIRTHLRRAFEDYRSPFVSVDVLLTWGTSRFTVVRIQHDPRTIGVSGYTLRKLVIHALNMLTGFSTFPLRIASWVGFTFTILGILVLAYVLIRYVVQGTTVPGFPFLASVISIFSGAQLFAIGVIGEYLARLHFRMMERPLYAVLERTGGETDEA